MQDFMESRIECRVVDRQGPLMWGSWSRSTVMAQLCVILSACDLGFGVADSEEPKDNKEALRNTGFVDSYWLTFYDRNRSASSVVVAAVMMQNAQATQSLIDSVGTVRGIRASLLLREVRRDFQDGVLSPRSVFFLQELVHESFFRERLADTEDVQELLWEVGLISRPAQRDFHPTDLLADEFMLVMLVRQDKPSVRLLVVGRDHAHKFYVYDAGRQTANLMLEGVDDPFMWSFLDSGNAKHTHEIFRFERKD